jgi:pimeloyl-ACP methyl ester carboxylesterase
LFATDTEESVRSLSSFLRLCLAREARAEDMYLMLGFNLAVPPRVRQALFSRSFDNDDLLPRLRKPALVVHGALDAIVKPSIVEEHKAGIAHADVKVIPGAGHASFWDQPARFNECLRTFCASL